MRTGSAGRQTLTVQRQKQTDGEKAGALVAIDEGVLDSALARPLTMAGCSALTSPLPAAKRQAHRLG